MSLHVEVLQEMFAVCANERRMKEADALAAAIASLSGGEPVAWLVDGVAFTGRTCYDKTAIPLFTHPATALAGGGEAVAWLIFYNGRVVGYATHESKPYAMLGEGETMVAAFTHPAGAVQVTEEMVDRACSAYWGDGWEEPEHEGLAEARKIDARFMLEAALNPGGSRE